MNWSDKWEVNFGKLTTRQIELMDAELSERVPNISDGEVARGVADVADKHRTGAIKYKPAVNDLITSIVHARGAAGNRESSDDVYMNRMRHSIKEAQTDIEKWNILCSPTKYTDWAERDTTVEEAKSLERWCEMNYIDFERPAFRSVEVDSIRKR